MRAFKKFLIRFLSVLFILTAIPFFAGANELPPPNGAETVLLYSIDGQKTVFSKNSKANISPSALTKIVSGLILCEELDGRLDEEIRISSEMLKNSEGRSFGLNIGDALTVRDLLRIAVCGSYNDAFCALAVYSAGSYDAFISKMNEKARSLGASDSFFESPTGIGDEKMNTTAEDMLIFCLAAAENKLFMDISSAYSCTVTVNRSVKNIVNRNALHDIYGEYRNDHALGFASGMTDLGGYCLATLGSYGGARYICIIMGAEENREYELALSLLLYASENYSVSTLKKAGEGVGSIPVTLTDLPTELPLVLGKDINILLEANSEDSVEKTYRLVLMRDTLEAPVDKGEVVGYMIVHSGGEILACVPVITAKGGERSGFLGLIEGMKAFIGGRIAISALVFAVIFTVIAIIAYYSHIKKKRRTPVYARGRYR
ncbi:MAG: D-alanyl-D-alanine carboxypeptidase [Ruminococcaceae bacterium]|nr:D-alanyl-D-alanine carboxypeptidase [Oscillospiraceae bacterium]